MSFTIHQGDCLEVLAGLAAESLEACACDPPYGYKFMGKGWDHGVPGVPYWQAVLRVLKPGAHLLAFGGTRTFHRLACGIEDAGFELRDTLGWLYGSGFPKSLDVSKAMDKAAGAERRVVGKHPRPCANRNATVALGGSFQESPDITQPSTLNAQRWSGWGTALKPAWEPIILARKPLCGTVAENVLRYGTGAVNVDGCRVEAPESPAQARFSNGAKPRFIGVLNGGLISQSEPRTVSASAQGRWPANVLHDGSAEVLEVFPQTKSGKPIGQRGKSKAWLGTESLSKVMPLTGFGDAGSAARFFFCAKASKHDREEGLGSRKAGTYGDGIGMSPKVNGQRPTATANTHPTVKPTKLMRYLCRLVTPPGGTVLDPFCGSGSTGKAALIEGFNFVGIEREAEYVAIARARCAHAAGQGN